MKRLLCGLTLLLAPSSLPAQPSARPSPAPLILVGRGLAADRRDHLVVWRSPDGTSWSLPSSVIIDGAPARTVSRPHVSFEDGLYHLLWLDPQGGARHATSRDALTWTGSNPLATFSPTSGATFAAGGGKLLALLTGAGRAVVVDLDSTRPAVVHPNIRSASIAFGRGKFIVAAVEHDWSVVTFASTDGVQWTRLGSPILASTPLDQGRDATIGFADDRFLLAVGTRIRSGPGASAVSCTYFENPDGDFSTLRSSRPCATTDAGGVPTRFQGHDVVFLNLPPSLLVSVDSGPARVVTNINVNGEPSMVSAPIPRATATAIVTPTVREASPWCEARRQLMGGTVRCGPPCASLDPQVCPAIPYILRPCPGDQALTVTYRAGAGTPDNCSDMALRLRASTGATSGAVVMTTFVAPGETTSPARVPFPDGFVSDGSTDLTLHIEAVGRVGGCNTGCLMSWAPATLEIERAP
jgi:hypothetical protein